MRDRWCACAHSRVRFSHCTGGEKDNVWTTGGGGGGIGKVPSIEVRGDECLARAGEQRSSIHACFDPCAWTRCSSAADVDMANAHCVAHVVLH